MGLQYTEADLEAARAEGVLDAAQFTALIGFLESRKAVSQLPRFDLSHVLWYAGALIIMGAMGLFSTLAFKKWCDIDVPIFETRGQQAECRQRASFRIENRNNDTTFAWQVTCPKPSQGYPVFHYVKRQDAFGVDVAMPSTDLIFALLAINVGHRKSERIATC